MGKGYQHAGAARRGYFQQVGGPVIGNSDDLANNFAIFQTRCQTDQIGVQKLILVIGLA
ncbi:hypothetical protein MNBD_ALPHA12-2060, partial [hydrothermal vent metagenome]